MINMLISVCLSDVIGNFTNLIYLVSTLFGQFPLLESPVGRERRQNAVKLFLGVAASVASDLGGGRCGLKKKELRVRWSVVKRIQSGRRDAAAPNDGLFGWAHTSPRSIRRQHHGTWEAGIRHSLRGRLAEE